MLISGYAHVFRLLSVVVVTLPSEVRAEVNTRRISLQSKRKDMTTTWSIFYNVEILNVFFCFTCAMCKISSIVNVSCFFVFTFVNSLRVRLNSVANNKLNADYEQGQQCGLNGIGLSLFLQFKRGSLRVINMLLLIQLHQQVSFSL